MHTLTHFESSTCLGCNKHILRINDSWYELHDILNCNSQTDAANIKTNGLFDNSTYVNIADTADESWHDERSHDESYFEQKQNVEDEPKQKILESVPTDNTLCQNKVTESATKDKKINRKQTDQKKAGRKKEPKSKQSPKAKQSNVVAIKIDKKRNRNLPNPCICDICNKTLKNVECMRSHMKAMHTHAHQTFTCDICGSVLKNYTNLKVHMGKHNGIKNLMCPFCGKRFYNPSNMRYAIILHFYAIPKRIMFCCNYNYLFKNIFSVSNRGHMQTHSVERNFKCKTCEKTFRSESNLYKHARIHSGEKRCKCPIEGCDRAYIYEIDLKRHKFSAHGIYTKKHPCLICQKVFPENKLLKKHLQKSCTMIAS